MSFSSKPSPWIFMSWIKPPSSLRLPAQCLGSLLPKLLATKSKKSLQNRNDQKQSAVILPFLAYAPWQRGNRKESLKDASCKPCPASFPQFQMEAPHAPCGGSLGGLNCLLLLVFRVAQSPGSAAFRGKTVTILQFMQVLE